MPGTRLCVAHTVQIPESSLARLKVPAKTDRIYKEECAFSFDAPPCPTGLYLNLVTWQPRGERFLDRDYQLTKTPLYLHQKWTKETKEKKVQADGSTVVDLGPEWQWKKTYQIVLMPEKTFIPYSEQLPAKLVEVVQAVIDNVAPVDMSSFDLALKGKVSVHALDLVQLNNGKKISPNPKDWKCEITGSTENLWLNLSTGFIGDGRRQLDGSGGNETAFAYYKEQLAAGNNYPLVVKLGTITPSGADVYSYAEDDAVVDPHLAQHLAHWGIDIMKQEKTVKSMAELEMDASMKLQFDRVVEAGENLVRVSGPGFVGIDNIGNSCYINSLLQIFYATPEFKTRYLTSSITENAPSNPIIDLNVQLSKMATGLLTDTYLSQDGKDNGYRITAAMLKRAVAENHQDFKTGQQQDVFQYFQHFLSVLERYQKRTGGNAADMSKLFTFEFEERVECGQTKQVAYKVQAGQNVLMLPVPIDDTKTATPEATQAADENPSKKAKVAEPEIEVSFAACLDQFANPQQLTDFKSPATGQKGTASKTTRFHSFPKYLAMQVHRFVLGPDWLPRKINVRVKMPTELDLNNLRGHGLQAGETELKAPAAAVVVDNDILAQLLAMGIAGENGCKRACVATKNAGVEVAVDWVFAHQGDADFELPLPGDAKPEVEAAAFPDEIVGMLASMGFSNARVIQALKATGGNPDRAGEWLFSHEEQPEAPAQSQPQAGGAAAGSGKYELMGFISHIGPDTRSGHYVAHICKNGKWYIFDDSKVAESKAPPFEWGYLYFYKQT